ncbi:hypothetical protein [Variovorax sp. YR752]|uniref:hypothetical protein n=1 Tax=Variovorax sp. YR752 TaxID=1884383 RepID=UPI00313835A4
MKTLLILTRLFSLVAALACANAHAAIADGSTVSDGAFSSYQGNGELALSVFDSAAKISYTLDLGTTLDDFFIDGQQDAGNQRFWEVDDAQWNSFLSQVDRGNLRWSVFGRDATGGIAAGGVRLFTTVRQGDESLVGTMTNNLFFTGIGGAQMGSFYSAIRDTGTHGTPGVAPDFTANGSSVNADFETGNGYYGEGGVGFTPNLNGNAPFNMANAVGQSSWFYYLTRSGTNQLDTITVDEFDNLNAGSSGDGYWGFIYVDPALYPDSPYAGSYLLSYTIAPYLQQARIATAEGRARAALIEYLSGIGATPIDKPVGEYVGYVPLTPVPEPPAALLLLAGAAALVAARRTKRRG